MVSNKKSENPRKRPYTLRARARRRDEVHNRITEATVQLHGTVGPVRTTVREIAKIAGVRRATVYNHFPTDRELFDACSSHWFSENPPPDPTPWAEVPDPARRAEIALSAMYDYYDQGRDMLENVLRDAPLVPALGEILEEKWRPLMERIAEILAGGAIAAKSDPAGDHLELLASLRVALDFSTWKSFADSGLSNDEAARLSAAWVDTVRKSPPSQV